MRDLQAIADNFKLPGPVTHAEPFGSGHINDTYSLTVDVQGPALRYVLQRINHHIFHDPPAMMDNIRRVTAHIAARLSERRDELADRQLTVIDTRHGEGCYRDASGQYWRIYNRIEHAITYDTLDSLELAREVARMFGWFQAMLTDLPGGPLHETIVDFHNTPRRFETFERVVRQDPCNRAADVAGEIDFVFENADICGCLLDRVEAGEIPVRVTHNDTKINNVMLDERTHRGVCVIDLDTVMPGLSLYDFGDMVRTATNSAAEDEPDPSKVTMRMPVYEMLVKGFAEQTHGFLTPAERRSLALAGKLITFEQLIRFLGDHIAGDTYYKIHRPGQNLDRARTQMEMVRSIQAQEPQMNELARSVFAEFD